MSHTEPTSGASYPGGELELFARAKNWKHYWCSKLRPYLGNSVLEVGAGIGTNTLLLRDAHQNRWTCLEPDPELVTKLQTNLAALPKNLRCETSTGTLAAIDPKESFDCILYIDVLEHIKEDRGELERASLHLNPGGHLVVLSPAHPWLFSEFDHSIGHFRRYTAPMLAALTPESLKLKTSFYLDSVGLLASGANRFLLGQSLPDPRQIALWDKLMVPCSRIVDLLTFHRFGKSVIAVWMKPL